MIQSNGVLENTKQPWIPACVRMTARWVRARPLNDHRHPQPLFSRHPRVSGDPGIS